MKNEKPKADKNQFMGMPMNWDRKNILKTLWNADDDRLFPPKSFGIGWTMNFHAVLRAAGILKKDKRPRSSSQAD